MEVSPPTAGYTFRDLVIRVAEYLGVANYGTNADEKAQVPSDNHDLDLCKRLVNDGIRMFIADNPKWNWLDRVFRLNVSADGDGPWNVAGDPARYYMPPDFNGDGAKGWTFDKGEDVPPTILIVSERQIRRRRSFGAEESGEPFWAAFRPLEDSEIPEGTGIRWEVMFYPEPGEDYTLLYRFRHYFNELVDLDRDRQPAGVHHDEAVLAACLAKAEIDRDDTAGARMQFYRQKLANSIRIDQQAAPTNLGYNGDASGRHEFLNRSMFGFDRPTSRYVDYQ